MSAARPLVTPYRVIGLAAVAGLAGGYVLRKIDERQHLVEAEVAMNMDREQLLPPSFPRPPPLPPPDGPSFNIRAVEGVPAYPNALPADLLSQPPGVGSEMQLVWFETDDSPTEVLHFYHEKFAEKGLFALKFFYSDAAGYVGYLDPSGDITAPDGQKLHLISAIKQGSRTVVFASSSFPKKLLTGGQLPPEVPVLPGTSTAMRFDFDERSLAQSSWVATIEDKTVAEVIEWYEKSFKEKGWRVSTAQIQEDGSGKVEATRPPTRASVAVRRKDERLAVYLTLSE